MVAQLGRGHKVMDSNPKNGSVKAGTAVHFKTPINGRPDQGYVQTDFMFLSNVPWSKFVLGAMPADSASSKAVNAMFNEFSHCQEYGLQIESNCWHSRSCHQQN
jgi:hypothetical protein